MRISNRTLYANINQRLGGITADLKQINEQISSSMRINRPSDDPIGITQSLGLKKVLAQIEQYGRNAQSGTAWMNLTDSVLQSTSTLITRAKEIANQMATGTYTDTQRQSAANEVSNMLAQLVQMGNSQLNGRYLFSGYRDDQAAFSQDLAIHAATAASGNNPAYTGTATASGTFTGLSSRDYLVEIVGAGAVGTATYRVSEDGGATWGAVMTTATTPTAVFSTVDEGAQIAFSNSGTLTAGDRFTIDVSRYQGDDGRIGIAMGPSSQVSINLTGEEAFGAAGESDNLLDVVAGLERALETNDVSGVQKTLDLLGSAQTRLTSAMADLGSRQNRVEANQSLLSDLETGNTARLSEVQDVDITQAMTDLTAKQYVYQAALYSATQITKMSLVDYL
jgi:flagellar hook-associated protein 3